MATTITVQVIHSQWTKASRGGRQAQLRNRVPLAFPIQSVPQAFLLNLYYFGEMNTFVEPYVDSQQIEKLESVLDYKWKSFALKWDGQSLDTIFEWTHHGAGAPEMIYHDATGNKINFRRVLPVPYNTWVRMRWSGRFTDVDTGQWWYEHTVINVAYFEDKVRSDIFLDTHPSNEFHRLPNLR